jgi:hypothetical protein
VFAAVTKILISLVVGCLLIKEELSYDILSA